MRAGFLIGLRKLAEDWRLPMEPEESLPRDSRVVLEPCEEVEATETERGDISRSARSSPRMSVGFRSGGGV